MQDLYILKIGGGVIDKPLRLNTTLKAFAAISAVKILVHGGGNVASRIATKMGVKPVMVRGRRVTDQANLDVVQMVYAGLLNKNIVAGLQALHCNAIGLSGADANCIVARKREVGKIDYGFAGDIEKVDSAILKKILNAKLTPVICALTHDGQGQILNTNADTISAEVAKALALSFNVHLLLCFEKEGVMENYSGTYKLIKHLTKEGYNKLKQENQVYEGMLPKLDNSFKALQAGVRHIRIMHYGALDKIVAGVDTGTEIVLNNP